MKKKTTKKIKYLGGMNESAKRAMLFLLPPHPTHEDRWDAEMQAFELVREAMELCIRGDRLDCAFMLLKASSTMLHPIPLEA